MKNKTKKKNKTKHRHSWKTDLDSCFNCGYYEAVCYKCDTIGLFNSKGKLVDTIK